MSETFIEHTEDEFDDRYTLVRNHLDPHASWAYGEGPGCLFNTYGPELQFVTQQDPRTIWTLVDGDEGNQYVLSGFHFVNRIGYLISKEVVPESINIEVLIPTETDPEPEDGPDEVADDRRERFTRIAFDHLGIPTLETRNSDSLDFHTVAVWAVASAIETAYEAGLQSVQEFESELGSTLEHVRATLKLRHLDQATDADVEEAVRMADDAIELSQRIEYRKQNSLIRKT